MTQFIVTIAPAATPDLSTTLHIDANGNGTRVTETHIRGGHEAPIDIPALLAAITPGPSEPAAVEPEAAPVVEAKPARTRAAKAAPAKKSTPKKSATVAKATGRGGRQYYGAPDDFADFLKQSSDPAVIADHYSISAATAKRWLDKATAPTPTAEVVPAKAGRKTTTARVTADPFTVDASDAE